MNQQLTPKKVSGIEILQAMTDGVFPHPSIAHTMPMKFVEVKHGGFAAAVLDSVTSCAIHSTLASGDIYGTVDLNIPKSAGIAEGDIRDEAGKLYAYGNATCVITRNI
ncbi:MAG: acyl-coenzyme A thioesterase PaaI-like protein [Moritella sp.]|jgi:acyl-coenzyme A thioesterase PaaI-like protein